MSEELILASKGRVAELLEPINGGVGEDISYDEKFEEIKTEVEKIASLTGEKPNWGQVSTSSEEILQEKSKDFRVACYLATCRAIDGNLEHLLDAVTLLSEMTTRYWDDMFPPLGRIRARAGMVGWWSDQSGPLVSEFKLKAGDNALVSAIDAASVSLDTLFREKFGEHYTGMGQIRESIKHLVRTCPKEKPKEVPKPAAGAEGGGPGAAAPPPRPAPVPSAGASIGALGSLQDAEKALEPAGQVLVRIARAMRATKPEHAMAYRLTRMGIWLDFTSAPQADGGVTLVPSPPANRKEALDGMLAANDYLALINAAEDATSDYPVWLDPHRYVSTAMSAMGALFMKAHDELLLGMALFLKRIPTMIKLQFSDGVPFADGATQMWIEQQVAPVLAGNGAGGGGGGGAPSVLDEPLKEARDLVVKGELGKALGVIASAAAGAPTPADRFRGRLAMAQLCLGAGKYSIARSQLEGLAALIDQHNLTTWDPALCSDVYGALYAAIKGMNDARKTPGDAPAGAMGGDGPAVPPEETAAELAAFQALCRLDPAVALKLAGG